MRISDWSSDVCSSDLRWPDAEITGIDNSPEMLAHARREAPDMQWQQADIADWRPTAPVDLLFTYAALHCLFGREELFPRLFGDVAPGGFYPCQITLNLHRNNVVEGQMVSVSVDPEDGHILKKT